MTVVSAPAPALSIVKEVSREANGPWNDTSISVTVGDTVYYRIRAKHPATGEKWIRPMRLNGRGYVLSELPAKAQPPGKLIYRLHDIFERADDLVIVTEGELKAEVVDTNDLRFQNSIVVKPGAGSGS